MSDPEVRVFLTKPIRRQESFWVREPFLSHQNRKTRSGPSRQSCGNRRSPTYSANFRFADTRGQDWVRENRMFSEFPKATFGRLAQLARAPRLHRGGRGFESLSAHSSASRLSNEFSREISVYAVLSGFCCWVRLPVSGAVSVRFGRLAACGALAVRACGLPLNEGSAVTTEFGYSRSMLRRREAGNVRQFRFSSTPQVLALLQPFTRPLSRQRL